MIEEIIRKLVKDELLIHRNEFHRPFGVYTGDGEILTKSYYDVLYYVSSHDCIIAPHLILNGIYESELTKYILKNINESSVFVDVGANFGYYSCMVAKNIIPSHGGKVYSFDANEDAFNLLKKNILANWIPNESIQLYHSALSNIEKKVQFRNYKYKIANSQFLVNEKETDTIDSGEIKTVITKTLDSYLSNIKKIDFIKIDVEGAEFQIIQGADLILEKNQQIKLLIEWNNSQLVTQGDRPEDFTQYLKNKNFKPYTLKWEDGSTVETTYDYLLKTEEHLCGVLFAR